MSISATVHRKTSILTWFFTAIFAVALFWYVVSLSNQPQTQSPIALTPEQQSLVDKYGPMPERRSTGAYIEVLAYLIQTAHDPDSITVSSCTNLQFNADGWLVGCSYSGKNAASGTIRKRNWFTVRDGRVVAMHKSDAYRWQ